MSIFQGNAFKYRSFDLQYYLLPVNPEDYFEDYFEAFKTRIIDVNDFLRSPTKVTN
jgi:hypothetical protein